MTHADLSQMALRWLALQRCVLYVTEPVGWSIKGERPDAVGWQHDGTCYVVECKVSRADFLRDAKKPHRALGLGHRRYFFAPPGLISPDELPEGWGLLEVRRGVRAQERVKAAHRETHNEAQSAAVLIHLARRACDYNPAALCEKIEAERVKGRQEARKQRERAKQQQVSREESWRRLQERYPGIERRTFSV